MFLPGDIVTLEWARNHPREDAPLFIVLCCMEKGDMETGASPGDYCVYCYYSNSERRYTSAWVNTHFIIPPDKLIKFNI
jgi:hypothetical protein